MASQVSHVQGAKARGKILALGPGRRGPCREWSLVAITVCSWKVSNASPHLWDFRIRDRRITVLGGNVGIWLQNIHG